jgi:hypothetical protein
VFEDIKASTCDMSSVERSDECFVVDNGPAACVDYICLVVHKRQRVLVYQVPRCCRQGEVHGNKVGAGEEFVKVNKLDAEIPEAACLYEGVVSQDSQVERPGFDGNLSGDSAEAEQADGTPCDTAHNPKLRITRPPTSLHGAVALGEASRAGEQ